MTKRLLLLSTLLTAMCTVHAEEYRWLTFSMADTSEISVAAENLALRYSDRNLHLSSPTVDQTLPVNRILSMRFTSDTTGSASIADTAPEAAEYFTLDGVCMGCFPTPDDARRLLPSGIYVAKTAGHSVKLIF